MPAVHTQLLQIGLQICVTKRQETTTLLTLIVSDSCVPGPAWRFLNAGPVYVRFAWWPSNITSSSQTTYRLAFMLGHNL